MGVKIFDLVPSKEIGFKDLVGKTIAVDGNLVLYQFLSSIRQADGGYLLDSNGNVTSHLSGLFSRTTRLMKQGIKLCFVFDGKAPKLKEQERQRRKELKKQAELKYNEAVASADIEMMRKYASRTSHLTKEMIDESKDLLVALGIPVVLAPSEGEAQASLMVKNKDAYAVGSQDGDCFMFGCPRLIKNLTLNSKKKSPNKLSYSTINPELIQLDEVLNTLGVDQDHLIALSMLIGTDYNYGGIKGIGPKNALKLAKKHPNLGVLFKEVKWDDFFEYKWEEVFNLIKNIPTTKDYTLKWCNLDKEKITEILIEKHDFSRERVDSTLSKLIEDTKGKEQLSLGEWM